MAFVAQILNTVVVHRSKSETMIYRSLIRELTTTTTTTTITTTGAFVVVLLRRSGTNSVVVIELTQYLLRTNSVLTQY